MNKISETSGPLASKTENCLPSMPCTTCLLDALVHLEVSDWQKLKACPEGPLPLLIHKQVNSSDIISKGKGQRFSGFKALNY